MSGWIKSTLNYRDRPVYFLYCGRITTLPSDLEDLIACPRVPLVRVDLRESRTRPLSAFVFERIG